MMATRADNVPAPAPQQFELPDAETLGKAGALDVLDAAGNAHSFQSLYTSDAAPRQLLVFIRHFFCGNCQEYVRALSRDLSAATLAGLHPPARLVLIGCGDPALIAKYKADTNCAYPIYCDPSRKLYAHLGMVTNLGMGDSKPKYITTGVVGNFLGSLMGGVATGPAKMFKGGDFSQNGGEWYFEGGELRWCHRMRNTRDHAEIEELQHVLGITEKP